MTLKCSSFVELNSTKAESLRTSTTALPGAPLTSFFDSLSPLQKQLLLQQQFQQVSPSIVNQNGNPSSFLPSSLENSLLKLQGTNDIWFSVSSRHFYFHPDLNVKKRSF